MLKASALVGPAGQMIATQERIGPSVYLDICAYREIIKDPVLSARFEKALLSKGGTLALSSHVFCEFASPNNAPHAPKAGDLLDRLYPHLYFQQWHHEKVAITELERGANADGSEDADWVFFSGQMRHTWDPNAPNARVGDVLRALGEESASRDVMRHTLRRIFPAELPKFDAWADRLAGALPDPSAHRAKMIAGVVSDARATRCLRHAVMDRYLLNRSRKREPNDVYDIGHSIVSTAYCEFVVLDTYFGSIVNESCREIRKAGSVAPLATVFPRSKVAEFIGALENFQPKQ